MALPSFGGALRRGDCRLVPERATLIGCETMAQPPTTFGEA
jgi:hypothetical protein